MGNHLKNFSSVLHFLVCTEVDNTILRLETYTELLHRCPLLGGCLGQCTGSDLELIPVGLCVEKNFHSKGWSLGIRTQRIRATGVIRLKKDCHQRKMSLMSNMIKSNANSAVICFLTVNLMYFYYVSSLHMK